MPAVPQKKIEVRAYELWEEAGRPHGRSDDFWFQATTELAALSKRTGVKTPGKTAEKADSKPVAPKAAVAEKAAKPKATKAAAAAEPVPSRTKKKAPAKAAK